MAAAPLAAEAPAAAPVLPHQCPCWRALTHLATRQALLLRHGPLHFPGAALAAATARAAAGPARCAPRPGLRALPPARCCHLKLHGLDCPRCRCRCSRLQHLHLHERDQQALIPQMPRPRAASPLWGPRPPRPPLPRHLPAAHHLHPCGGRLPLAPGHSAGPVVPPAPAAAAAAAARRPWLARAAAAAPGAAAGRAPAGPGTAGSRWAPRVWGRGAGAIWGPSLGTVCWLRPVQVHSLLPTTSLGTRLPPTPAAAGRRGRETWG